MNQIINKLNWRYATKAFDSTKKISDEDMNTIQEAFRLTPSSFGLQPWKLIVIKNQDIQDSLVEHSWGQEQISNCSHLLVLCRRNTFWDEDVESFVSDIKQTRSVTQEDVQGYEDMMKWFLWRMDDEDIKNWIDKQIYIALWNLMTVCAEMQIDSCPVEWFIPNKYDEILWLNEKGISSVVVLALWYRSQEDKYSELSKVRFSQDKIIDIVE